MIQSTFEFIDYLQILFSVPYVIGFLYFGYWFLLKIHKKRKWRGINEHNSVIYKA